MRRNLHDRPVRRCPACGMIDIAVNRTAISSTNLVAVGWEPDQENSDNGTLEVEFKRGAVYQYTDVPSHVYQALIFAPSPGSYFKANIHQQYEGQRIE